jgi:hypothetical protein
LRFGRKDGGGQDRARRSEAGQAQEIAAIHGKLLWGVVRGAKRATSMITKA